MTLSGITRDFSNERRSRLARPLRDDPPPGLPGGPARARRPAARDRIQQGAQRPAVREPRDASGAGVVGSASRSRPAATRRRPRGPRRADGAARVPARGDERGPWLGGGGCDPLYRLRRGPHVLLFPGLAVSVGPLRAARRPAGTIIACCPTSVRGADDPGRGDFGRRPSCPSSLRATRPRTSTGRRPTSCTTAASATSTPAGSPTPTRRWSPSSVSTPCATISSRRRRGCCCSSTWRGTTPAGSSATSRSSARSRPTCTSPSTRCWPSAGPMPRSARPRAPTWAGWRLAEASYQEDARVGELLRQRRASGRASRSCCGSGASRPAARWLTPTSSAWRN